MKNYLLLTGATGFIGQYLLRRLLLRGVPLAVIARNARGRTARERVEQIVAGIEADAGRSLTRPITFTGNIAEDMLGLDENALDWFQQNCGTILHSAASIRFHAPDHDRMQDPWLSNLQGTQHLLEVCRMAEITNFHNVSTAYVSGDRVAQVCYENQLNCGQGFLNDYQQSKAEAEQAIRESEFLTARTFYRPALVVGDSRTGFTTAPDFGLYHYIQFLVEVIKRLRSDGNTGTVDVPLRVRFTGNENRNIVTVDWVADMIVHILTHAEYHNETYHLTPKRASTSREILRAMIKYFDCRGIEFIGGKEIPKDEQTDVERHFYDFATTFEPYWEDEPIFDRRNTDRVADGIETPPVDAACLERLIHFAAVHCFGYRPNRETAMLRAHVAVGPRIAPVHSRNIIDNVTRTDRSFR